MTPQRPAGTVYGRGGVDVREPGGLHPVVLALVVVAAITALLTLGYWVFLRSPAETPRPAAQPAAGVPAPPAIPPSAPSAAPSAVPSASPSPTAAPTFGVGRVLLSGVAEPGTSVVADGDFAAMRSGGAPGLTVIRGLADSRCFTVRDQSGRYLRHFNFRLRFDRLDDSDLFRQDATFCPADDQRAGVVRLRSKNYPDRLLHRRGDQLHIDKPDGSDDFQRDSSFTVRKG